MRYRNLSTNTLGINAPASTHAPFVHNAAIHSRLFVTLIFVVFSLFFSTPCLASKRFVKDQGLKLLDTGHYDEVVTWADREIRRRPKNADAMLKAGVAILYKSYQTGSGLDRAESYFRRAVDADPLHPLARYSLAAIYLKTGRARAAIPELRRAVVIAPGFTPAHLGLVSAYLKTGDGLSAMAAYDRALRSNREYVMNQSLKNPEARRRVRSMEMTLFRQMNARLTRILFSPNTTQGGAARVLFLSTFAAAAGAALFAKGWWLRA